METAKLDRKAILEALDTTGTYSYIIKTEEELIQLRIEEADRLIPTESPEVRAARERWEAQQILKPHKRNDYFRYRQSIRTRLRAIAYSRGYKITMESKPWAITMWVVTEATEGGD